MKVKQAYAVWSASYDQDRNLTRDLDHQLTLEMLAGLRCKLIVEFGCGTGKNTALLAGIGEEVRAFDFSEQMIARARQKISHENVTFEIADITQPWPCSDGSTDLVVCNLVLEHVENINFVFSEAARVLRHQARFFVSELHPFRQYQGVVAHFTRGDKRTEVPAFVHHLTDFFDAAVRNGLSLLHLKESWHMEDHNQPPRLVSFMFAKQAK